MAINSHHPKMESPLGPQQHQPTISQEWSSGPFDCFEDAALCLEVVFCWHAQFTAQWNMLQNNERGPMLWLCLGFALCDLLFVGIPSQICIGVTRGLIRKRYEIPCTCQECLTQCVLTNYGCMCCLHCQHHREMRLRGEYPGGCLAKIPQRRCHMQIPEVTAFPSQDTFTSPTGLHKAKPVLRLQYFQ